MKDTSPDFTRSVSDMTDTDRAAAISRLEEQREQVISEIEEIMQELSQEMKTSRYKARRFKLGKSPNDYSAK